MEIKKEKATQLTCDDILCNKCGESCKKHVDVDKKFPFYNHVSINRENGYLSKGVEDIHICNDCYEEFKQTFAINPDETGELLG